MALELEVALELFPLQQQREPVAVVRPHVPKGDLVQVEPPRAHLWEARRGQLGGCWGSPQSRFAQSRSLRGMACACGGDLVAALGCERSQFYPPIPPTSSSWCWGSNLEPHARPGPQPTAPHHHSPGGCPGHCQCRRRARPSARGCPQTRTPGGQPCARYLLSAHSPPAAPWRQGQPPSERREIGMPGGRVVPPPQYSLLGLGI